MNACSFFLFFLLLLLLVVVLFFAVNVSLLTCLVAEHVVALQALVSTSGMEAGHL